MTAPPVRRSFSERGNDLPRGFKMTEIGPLPAHWDAGRLGEAAVILMGQSPPGASYNDDGNGCPLINGPTEYGSSALSTMF